VASCAGLCLRGASSLPWRLTKRALLPCARFAAHRRPAALPRLPCLRAGWRCWRA
jgi:hypothetical protein